MFHSFSIFKFKMVSLNVSQDDMIDILISQANVDISMNADENHSPSLPPIQPVIQPVAIQSPIQPVIQPVSTQSPIQPVIQPVATQSHSYPATYVPINPPNTSPQLPAHNQYVCKGCQQSILYTNRSSLVQLLSLHQQKCLGSQQYRYMCLECHSAFKSVVQLQAHESNCRGRPSQTANESLLNDKQQTENCIGTSVIQSLTHEGAHSSHHHNSKSLYQQSCTQDAISSHGRFSPQAFNSDGHHTNNQTHGIPENLQNTLQENCGQMSSENLFDTAKTAPAINQLGSRTGEIIGSMNEPKDSSESVQINNVQQSTKEGDFMHSMSETFYEQQQDENNEKQLGLGTESSKSDAKEQNVFVRDSWSQTYEQPPEEEVAEDILLDEISPAGRKRRTCARKLKVYREKELRKQREHAEIESLKRLSYGRRRAKIYKQQLKVVKSDEKVLKNIEKAAKLIKKEDNVNEQKQVKAKKYIKGKKEKEPELEVPMQCQQCPKTFTKYSMYTRHYQYYHERAMCQYCGTQCIRRKLKSHEATHLKAYKCTYPGCTKVVNSKHRLTRHSRIHTGEKPFKCEVCDKAFAGKENMVKHRKRVHYGEKPYQCRYCGRKFADTGRLKYHEGTHTKPRPTDYRCKFCGRGYKSHVGCYLHERTHTGNTVKCQYCGKAFMAKEHLKRHEYIHTGNYPFRCPNCQKGFKDAASMRKHKCLAIL